MSLFSYLLLLPAGIYLGYLVLVRIGLEVWNKRVQPQNYPEITVLICARNEALHLPLVLQDLQQLEYPGIWNVLVLDDHSEDATPQLLEKWDTWEKLTWVRPKASGKKAMITEVMPTITTKWVVTLDADTRVPPHWLDALLQRHQEAVMICGPVKMEPGSGLFGKMQTLEFAGLMGVGAGSLGIGLPSMCNGANLAYQTALFKELNGYEGNAHLPSGDDEFLMHKAAAANPGKVIYELSPEAMVEITPQMDWSAFWEQRKRWVSKSRAYRNGLVTWIMIAAWCFNLGLLALLVYAVISADWGAFAGLFLVKVLTEGLVIWKMTGILNQRRLIWLFVPEQFLHILYVMLVGLLGNWGKYEWKGRTFDSHHG